MKTKSVDNKPAHVVSRFCFLDIFSAVVTRDCHLGGCEMPNKLDTEGAAS